MLRRCNGKGVVGLMLILIRKSAAGALVSQPRKEKSDRRDGSPSLWGAPGGTCGLGSKTGDTQMLKAKGLVATIALMTGVTLGTLAPAMAGDTNGNFMVRVLGTGVITQEDLKSLSADGANITAGNDADVSDEFIPALTLTYFVNKNIAVELFCCFAQHTIDGEAGLAGFGEIAETWIFPPALTLQYHFDPIAGFKPYVGAGVQYIAFFDTKGGTNGLGASSVEIDDAFGFTLQAGVDVSLGGGWYLNADVKKTWLDTEVTWHNTALGGNPDVRADVDLDPLIVSAGLGYRFNLEDIFGRREAPAPLK